MNDWILFATAGLFGLILGSFLNVVIFRGPALWGLVGDDRRARGGFWGPRSYCPSCRRDLSIADLIPIIGFVRAKGRCSGCGAKILLRYPLVEALGAMAAIASVATFGVSWLALFAFGYLLLLIALAAIDLETGYLPDALTLPLIASGIAVNAGGGFTPLPQSLIGAVAGYVVFWIIAFAYRRLRGRDGLGGGDATLLSGIGAWTGWLSLAPIVFIASATALLFLGFMRLLGRRFDAATPVRFGPALCAAAALFVLFLTPYWLSR